MHSSSKLEVSWVSATSLKLSKLKGFNDPSYNILLWMAAVFIKESCKNPSCLTLTLSSMEDWHIKDNKEVRANSLQKEITSFELQEVMGSEILRSNFKIKYIHHDDQCPCR